MGLPNLETEWGSGYGGFAKSSDGFQGTFMDSGNFSTGFPDLRLGDKYPILVDRANRSRLCHASGSNEWKRVHDLYLCCRILTFLLLIDF